MMIVDINMKREEQCKRKKINIFNHGQMLKMTHKLVTKKKAA